MSEPTVRRTVIGIMGPGAGASEETLRDAARLGELVSQAGWVVLTGGRNEGVMNAASQGAHRAGGLVVGIVDDTTAEHASPWVDVVVVTGMGQGRNNANVLSSDVVVTCGMSSGTASEVALALRNGKPVVLLGVGAEAEAFFASLGGDTPRVASSPEHAVEIVASLLGR